MKESHFFNKLGYDMPVLIGKGAFSEVYRVREKSSGKQIVCKISLYKELLQREAKLLKSLSYPLFPRVFQYLEQENKSFLFMEYISGVSLEELLRKRGRFSEKRAVEIALELVGGLKYLHEQQNPILFRDLKPENIMIKQNGQVKLIDFGCACVLSEKEVYRSIAGTKGYAPNEQMMQGGQIGNYSDIYAFGKVFFYMLTGENPCKPPFQKGKIRMYNKKLSRGLEQLVEQCCKEDSEERIGSIRKIRQILMVYYTGGKWERSRMEFLAWLKNSQPIQVQSQKNIWKY